MTPITPLTGITANTLGALTIDAGVLRAGATIIGSTRGGFEFDPGYDIRSIPVDGARAPLKGYDRVIKYTSVMKGKLLEVKTTDIPYLYPGATSAGTTTVIYSPKSGGVLFAANEYIANLNIVGTKGDGSLIEIEFPIALIKTFKTKMTEAGEWEYDVEFEARNDPATPSICPFTFSMPIASLSIT